MVNELVLALLSIYKNFHAGLDYTSALIMGKTHDGGSSMLPDWWGHLSCSQESAEEGANKCIGAL